MEPMDNLSPELPKGVRKVVVVGVVIFLAMMLALLIGVIYILLNGGMVAFLERIGLNIFEDIPVDNPALNLSMAVRELLS